MKKRLLCMVLLLMTLIVFCTGCSDPQAEAGALRTFSEDYEKALTLYCAVYGKGLAVAEGYSIDESGSSHAQYAPVAEDCGYTSCAQLRADIEKYFTEELATVLCRIAFGSLYADGSEDGGNLSEGSSAIAPRYRDYADKLQINMVHTARFAENDSLIPDFDTVRATSSTSMRVILEAKMASLDGTVSGVAVEFHLLLEDDRWKFDSAPYVSPKMGLL